MLTEVLNVIHFLKIDSLTDKLGIITETGSLCWFYKIKLIVNINKAAVFQMPKGLCILKASKLL